MSTSTNVFLWKQKAEIDYIPLFVSLWLALDAWMSDRFIGPTDRARLESLKTPGHPVSERFSGLIQAGDATSTRFKANLAELSRALDNALIPYDRFAGRRVQFSNCILDWNNGQPDFGTILKTRNQRNKLKIDDNLWVSNNINGVYAVYIEIVYQIRCALFHGKLPPTPANERVIRQLYVTLSIIMEPI